jgi:enolase
MSTIKTVYAREILDSRGNPTLETSIFTDDGRGAVASIPSGASTGKHEAIELRDGDKSRYDGLGVLKACANVNQIIANAIVGMDPLKQNDLDQTLINLDGTENKSKLGANAILSVSQAVFELGANCVGLQTFQYVAEKYSFPKPQANRLPTPIFNLINGGLHGAGNIQFQEFHCIPSSRKLFSESLEMGSELYHLLKKTLIDKKAIHSVGDEGGFAPNLFSNSDAIELLVEAFESSKYRINEDVYIGLDIASSTLFNGGKISISDNKEAMNSEQFANFLSELFHKYNLLSIEDPFSEDDWEGWTNFQALMGKQLMIVGDDLICTNKKRLQEAITKESCNAIIVKPNQVGTITEAVQVIKLAKENNLSVVMSHRSGDTDEDFLADLAVGVGADFVKFGAPGRGERVSKYNRLLYIQEFLQNNPQ